MGRTWRYLIPSFLTLVYILMCTYGRYYYLYPLLLVANLLNVYWGEFKNSELLEELRYFYRSKTSYYLKCINAVVLLGLIAWGNAFVDSQHFSWGHLLGFSVTTGLLSGCFIVTLAHDLLHSRSRLQRVLSVLLLTVSGIPHFATEHVFGHHRNIGLKKDATTARLNEDFYTYFVKVTFSNLKDSFLTQYGLPRYLRRRVLFANLKMVGLLIFAWVLIYIFAENPGPTIFFFMLQGLVSYILYELINYIQHYGLHRRDEREEISQELSWNCYYKYTNYLLFLLPLHSLHHLPVRGRKTTNMKAGPRMPYLYFMMITMALLPPIWFYKMNRLALQHNLG